MKCPKCGGNGKEYWNGNVFCNTGFECDKCHGTGEVEQTNEEWLRQANTEQLAEWIATQCSNAVMENTYDVSKLRKKRYWEEWLKEKHDEM